MLLRYNGRKKNVPLTCHFHRILLRNFRFNVDDCHNFLSPPVDYTLPTKSSSCDEESTERITQNRKKPARCSKEKKRDVMVGGRLPKFDHQKPGTVLDEVPKISERRTNELNIQMLSKSLFQQIFGNASPVAPSSQLIEDARKDLKKFGLWKEVEHLPDVSLKLPKLEGNNIEQHFWNIGQQQSGPYKSILEKFVKCNLPKQPESWLCRPGWTKYVEGCDPQLVSFPEEDALVFDVEVCMKVGSAPTLATAVSPTAWYGWVCPALCSSTEPVTVQRYSPNLFIPLEGKGIEKTRPRIVVGHNVSYDRGRVKEQYGMTNSALRFMDTMSMHVCIGGVTSYQRAMLKTKTGFEDEDWREYSSLNSLKAVYQLYCKGELSKDSRNLFVEGTMLDIKNNFQDVMKYCGLDVEATFKVLQKMVPLFFDRFPHPVTLAGMLELGTAYLPVNSNWERYIQESDQTFDDLESECKFLLTRKADNACRLLNSEAYKDDLWMWDEDWSTQELALKKAKTRAKKAEEVSVVPEKIIDCEEHEENLEEKYQYLFDSEDRLPVRRPNLPGYPAWYRKLCEKPVGDEWVPGPQSVSTGVKIAPKILNLTWEGYPLHHTKQHGWGILVAEPSANVEETLVPYQKLKQISITKSALSSDFDINDVQDKVSKNFAQEDNREKQKKRKKATGQGVWTDHMVEDCCHFLKLPHKDGATNNVGNPLARDFIKTFSNSVLAGADAAAARVLEIGRMLSYWRNNRDRIRGQLAVWHNSDTGAIVPQVVVCGTLTRRAMEPTWMTASNAQAERIGSELRSMVQAPKGYHIVGADVDSQELWIASVMGDAASAGTHGSTPFGWMTLSGTKSNGTDMHSVTAAAAGISRDHAKVINYARIYGAGVRFAQRLLKQFNPGMTDAEAKTKATKMFLLTKGQKEYRIKPKFQDQVPDEMVKVSGSYNANRIAKIVGKPVNEVFESVWKGGTESAMFNRLEAVACSVQPRTPFLSARLSRAVEPSSPSDDSFLTTRINWVVQSGAADFLHLMLVSMRWLSQGRMRFCLSFHDEVRYLVPSDLRYEAALALHITNLLTRAFCASRLGLHDLPQSVAFFSSVEVDTVLRKEAKDDGRTPSNPHGLKKGYGVDAGESLDIYQTIDKCDGLLSRLHKKNRCVGL